MTADAHRYRWPDGTHVEPDGTIVFRPSWENYKQKILQAPAALLVLVAIALFRFDDPTVGVAVVVVTALLASAAMALYFRRALTSVGPRGVVRKDLVRSTVVPREQLGDAILVTDLEHFDPRIDATLILTDQQGTRVAMLNGPFWSPEQLYAMASALQQPTWQPRERISFRDIRARYPRAVPLHYARPVAFAFALAGAIILGSLLIGVAVYAIAS